MTHDCCGVAPAMGKHTLTSPSLLFQPPSSTLPTHPSHVFPCRGILFYSCTFYGVSVSHLFSTTFVSHFFSPPPTYCLCSYLCITAILLLLCHSYSPTSVSQLSSFFCFQFILLLLHHTYYFTLVP